MISYYCNVNNIFLNTFKCRRHNGIQTQCTYPEWTFRKVHRWTMTASPYFISGWPIKAEIRVRNYSYVRCPQNGYYSKQSTAVEIYLQHLLRANRHPLHPPYRVAVYPAPLAPIVQGSYPAPPEQAPPMPSSTPKSCTVQRPPA